MSTIDPSSNSSLTAILDKLGVNSYDANKPKAKESLGQEDFLKLMTTQLQNQDPFAPMENGEFIAQMAQFSTVTGITEMGETLKSLASQLSEFRVATASDLLGHSVLVPGNLARPNKDGEIHGVVDLPAASAANGVVISDMSGEVVHTIDLGSQSSGLVGFSWTEMEEKFLEGSPTFKIEAYTTSADGTKGANTSVFAEVLAASVDKGKSGVKLDVKDYGEVNASDVLKFRN